MKVLVTGCAGFIGSAVSTRLLSSGVEVLGMDNVNDYYDPKLKHDRIRRIQSMHPKFTFLLEDLVDIDPGDARFRDLDAIVHLGAQGGVRFSIERPEQYVASNLVGFARILELARHIEVSHLVYASSSSVYGANSKRPFSVADEVNHPVSFYAATKRSNELMAESYSRLYAIPTTGLRFFTAYGPWGRPDMAYFSFTKRIIAGESIRVFGNGELSRDYTFIDDIVDGVVACFGMIPAPSREGGSEVNATTAPHRILNLGNGSPVTVKKMIAQLEVSLGVPAICEFVGRQQGDVDHTLSDITETTKWCGYEPRIPLSEGIPAFVDWYRGYYNP